MHDLHQAIKLYDENNKKILQTFTDCILKRYESDDEKNDIRKKLIQQIKIKRTESRASRAVNLIQGFNSHAKENATWLLEGLVNFLYPKDENTPPDTRYWFDYENISSMVSNFFNPNLSSFNEN
jgi:translation initiation factor 1 (eIF-1/SUI1)